MNKKTRKLQRREIIQNRELSDSESKRLIEGFDQAVCKNEYYDLDSNGLVTRSGEHPKKVIVPDDPMLKIR